MNDTNENVSQLLDRTIVAENTARLFDVALDVFSDFPAHVRRANIRADTAVLASGNHNQRNVPRRD